MAETITDFVIPYSGIVSGQGEAVARKYHRYVGKSGRTWLVADQPNAADNIYVTNNPSNSTSRTQGFEGFGGATLRMPLVEGGVFELHGGWHSNSDALYEDTGVDIRDRCLTFVVIARKREFKDHNTILHDVVYQDTDWTLGLFNRGNELAKELLSPECPELIVYSKSLGGSICGPVRYST